MKDEFYFTLTATECQHSIVEWNLIRPFCKRLGVKVIYYRKFKTGHVPSQRECKIKGFNRRGFVLFKKWARTRNCPILFENYWKSDECLKRKEFLSKFDIKF